MSLVLTRKENEAVYIDRHIKVKIIEARNGYVKLSFDAPNHIEILREELVDSPAQPTDENWKLGSEEIFYNQSEVERGCHFC